MCIFKRIIFFQLKKQSWLDICMKEGTLRFPVLLKGYERDLPMKGVCVLQSWQSWATGPHTPESINRRSLNYESFTTVFSLHSSQAVYELGKQSSKENSQLYLQILPTGTSLWHSPQPPIIPLPNPQSSQSSVFIVLQNSPQKGHMGSSFSGNVAL